MNTKHVLAVAAVLISSQAFALTAHQKHMGCTNEGANCGVGASTGGGVGGGEAARYTQAYIIMGSLWETYEDSQGEFDIETNLSTGKKTVHFGGKAAFLIKPPPANSNMKRSALVHDALAPAPTLAQAQAKKKADEEKAKAAAAAKVAADNASAGAAATAAAKLAADKAAAEAAKAPRVYTVNAAPAGGGAMQGALIKP